MAVLKYNNGTGYTGVYSGGVANDDESIIYTAQDLTYQVAGGTATALTLTINTYANGYAKTFIAPANNNGVATTINTKPLYKPNTTDAPTLIAGKAYTVWYNLSGDCFYLETPIIEATIGSFKKGSSSYTDNDTSQTFTDAFCTDTSLVTVCITSVTLPKGVWSVESANGSFTITSTVAETDDITFDYYIQKAVG